MRDSAKQLRILYNELTEKKRQIDSNLKKQYGNNILLPDEKGKHCDCWILARDLGITPRAVDGFFSIYGLIVELYFFNTKNGLKDWYIKFEEDSQVVDVLKAIEARRLNIADRIINCYRLVHQPDTSQLHNVINEIL